MSDNITFKEWKSYSNLLKAIDNQALADFWSSTRPGGRFEGLAYTEIPRDDLIQFTFELVTKYGEASAAVSAEMYDLIASLQGANVPAALLAPTASYSDTAKMVNGVLKFSDNPESLAGGLSRLIKLAGCDTTLMNAHRDRPRHGGGKRNRKSGALVAWIPSGDTCAFCLTLASRGWQEQSLWAYDSHAEHIHGNCDCTYAVKFNKNAEYDWYDPDEYKKMYYSAEGSTPQERINSMRREAYAKDKKTEGTDNSELIHV